jgi:hypothetical protein
MSTADREVEEEDLNAGFNELMDADILSMLQGN